MPRSADAAAAVRLRQAGAGGLLQAHRHPGVAGDVVAADVGVGVPVVAVQPGAVVALVADEPSDGGVGRGAATPPPSDRRTARPARRRRAARRARAPTTARHRRRRGRPCGDVVVAAPPARTFGREYKRGGRRNVAVDARRPRVWAVPRSARPRAEQLRAALVGIVAVGAVLVPLGRDLGADSLPLSNYPMFTARRAQVTSIERAVGVTADGTEHVLAPELTGGTVEVIHAAQTIVDAIRGGSRRRAVCRDRRPRRRVGRRGHDRGRRRDRALRHRRRAARRRSAAGGPAHAVATPRVRECREERRRPAWPGNAMADGPRRPGGSTPCAC